MANNTIFFPALFCRINARVDIAFKCNNKCANFKKTRIFKQSRSFIEGKWRERQENGEIVWKITQMWRVLWRKTVGKWRFVVFSYFVSRCHGGIWPTLSKCFAFALYQPWYHIIYFRRLKHKFLNDLKNVNVIILWLMKSNFQYWLIYFSQKHVQKSISYFFFW